MDFDVAWCPACDRQIVPKRYTINVPTAPPPPPSSPKRTKGKTGGLVNGTGRLRHNGTIKSAASPVVMKQRTVIDQGPIPLYCSDECQFADLSTHRRGAPFDPAREEANSAAPILPASKKGSFSSESDLSSSSASQPMSSLDKLIAMYNFPPLPPPPPTFDEPTPDSAPREYTSGIMMAGKLITSLCPPPQKPHEGRYRPAQEPRKPIPGWTDGSNAWRSTVYSFTAPKSAQDPFDRDSKPSKAYGSFAASSHRPSSRKPYASSSNLASESAPAAIRSASDEMISKFSANFTRRSESRVSLYNNTNHPTSPTSCPVRSMPLSSPKRERSLVHPGAQGKLLVPDVKMKVHSGSSGSLSSAWSGPTSSSSRRSVRSPLSATSDSDDDTERCDSALSRPQRPIIENTRSWSYDNVKTYDIMPIPPKIKKVKKLERVDGQEREVEVEIEVHEEPKRLFLFAPTRISP